jgi:hypothetical protein
MALDEEITYWAARAAEERRIAASLPKGPPASIHLALAKLYERAIRDKRSRSTSYPPRIAAADRPGV